MSDLSTKAFWEWRDQFENYAIQPESVWIECRRRAEALERKAFEAGCATDDYVSVEQAWKEYKERK